MRSGIAVVFCLLALAACGDDAGLGSGTVGAAGGRVTGEDGAEVTFPPDALANNVTVRVAKDGTGAPSLPADAVPAGAVYTITPHGGALAMHAEVAIPVERTPGPDEQLLLVTAQAGDTQWTVLSGATYVNGVLRASVMHFSYFQAIVLTSLSVPTLVTTVRYDPYFWSGSVPRYNNVGGTGIGRHSADYEYNEQSWMQYGYTYLDAGLNYPQQQVPVARVGVPVPTPPRPCLPILGGSPTAAWSFLRDGNPLVLPIENGAAPAPGSNPLGTPLAWAGRVLFDAEHHNGRMRIDMSLPTDCNLRIEAVPIAFRVNLDSRGSGNHPYQGVMGYGGVTPAAIGQRVEMAFEEKYDGETQSIRWEFSPDLANWEARPVPPEYIRDYGRSGFLGNYYDGHRYGIEIPNVQLSHAGWYRAWACSRYVPASGGFPAVESVCVSRWPQQLAVVTDPPTVSTHPTPQNVLVGETANFGARPASPIEVTIQWQKRSLVDAAFNLGAGWTDVPGANDIYYTTPATVAADGGMLYRAVFTSAAGSTATNPALLTVLEQLSPPVVQAQPANLNVVVGGTAVFVATAGGTPPLSYQWRRNAVNITGANSQVLTLNNVAAANDAVYTLVISNRAGSVTTEPARLVVTQGTPVDLPPTIAAPPASITVAAGQAANFAVAVNGTGPYSYIWYKDGSSTPIPGADGASFGIPVAATGDAGTYAVRVTNAAGTALSTAATLAVTPGTGVIAAPTITSAPMGVAAVPGTPATFAVAVTGTGPFSYQWYKDGVAWVNAIGPVFRISSVITSDAGQYTLEVRNAAGVAVSAPVPLIVIGAPSITAQPAAASAAEGQSAHFEVSATGNGVGYQWIRNNLAIPGANAAGYTTPAVTQADNGALYGVLVYTGAGVVISNNALLTVTAAPAATKAWGSAALIETENAGDADNVHVAVNASGQAMAVWQQSDATTINIYASRYTPAGGWGTPQRISPVLLETSQQPTVAIDADGNALAVWMQSNYTQNSSSLDIWASRYTPAGGWTAAVRIEDGFGDAGNPQIAMDGGGNATVVFWQAVAGSNSIVANRYVNGGGWGTATAIESDNTGSASAPSIAMDAAGNATVVWSWASNDAPYNYTVWATRYSAGLGWGSAGPIDVPNQSVANLAPQVALDGAGNAIALWQRPAGTSWESILASRYVAGSGWGAPELIETGDSGHARDAQIAFDSNGNATAVWLQVDGVRANVLANRYTAGQGWGNAQLIETDNAGPAFEPRVVVDGSGNATAVWSHRNIAGFTFNIYANRWTAADGWGTAGQIDNAAAEARLPSIGVDSAGNVIAAWAQPDGPRRSIWANALR